jgi:hypothetical protein
MLAEWKREIIQKHKEKKIAFVHIPKCAGTYVKGYCKELGIQYLFHKNANKDPNIFYFSVIRNPIKRFESFLNYRLWKGDKQSWPKHLHYVFGDPSVDLNQIVSELEEKDFQGFHPYKTLHYWTQHCHLLITIDEFFDFLKECGFENIVEHPKENVSIKRRGTLNEESIQKIQEIYQKDIEIYQHWIRKDE